MNKNKIIEQERKGGIKTFFYKKLVKMFKNFNLACYSKHSSNTNYEPSNL